MDIRIEGDMNISRKNHCSISYDPKNRNFFITPGESNGLMYIGSSPIYETTKLHNYETLEIGESKFVFVKLCGEHFDWEKEKAKTKEE